MAIDKMTDVQNKLYSLGEIAQIIGVDEKELHRYAHKGFFSPDLSNDSEARFTEVDCARLNIIKRAVELGYKPENLFNLIGNPEEALKSSNSLSACEEFAKVKFKQIYRELTELEPLEQLSKQCDLRLLRDYIDHLRVLQNKPVPDSVPSRANTSPNTSQRSTGFDEDYNGLNSKQEYLRKHGRSTFIIDDEQEAPPSLAEKKQSKMLSSRVQSFSAAKLWDHIKKVEKFENESPDDSGQERDFRLENDRFLEDAEEQPTAFIELEFPNQDSSEHAADIPEHVISKVEKEPKLLVPSKYEKAIRIKQKASSIAHDDMSGDSLQSKSTAVKETELTPPDPDESELQEATQVTQVTTLSPDRRSDLDTKFRMSRDERFENEVDRSRKPFVKPTWMVYAGAALITITLVVTGYLLLFNEPDDFSRQAGMDNSGQSITNIQQDPSTEDSTTDGMPTQDGKGTTQGNSTTGRDSTSQTSNDASTNGQQQTAHVEDQSNTTAQEQPTRSDNNQPAVEVKNITISHDAANKVFKADFTISKNDSIPEEELVSGYSFIYLEIGNTTSEATTLVMPASEWEANRPVNVKRGARFSIKRLKELSVTTISELSPKETISGKVMVFSSEGDLILETPFTSKIHSIFSIAEDIPASQNDDVTEPAPSTPAVSKPEETQPTVVPDSETAEQQEQRQPSQSFSREAATWEQKSYDAAAQGDFDQAIADATKAIALEPNRVNPYINRSWAYIEKNMLDQAVEDCEKALSIDPQNAYAYNNRGSAHQRKSQMRKAQDDYRKACDLGLEVGCQNRNSLVRQIRIADLIDQSQTAFKNKDWDKVVRVTTEVISLDPKNTVAFTNRSAAYAQKNFLNKALQDSNDAIAFNPKFPLAYNNRGYVYELLGNNRKAAEDYLKSCDLGLDLGCKNHERLKRVD